MKYSILASSLGGLIAVAVRPIGGEEGPRATGKLVRWSKLSISELSVEASGGHRMVAVQVDSHVLKGFDDNADLICEFVRGLIAGVENRTPQILAPNMIAIAAPAGSGCGSRRRGRRRRRPKEIRGSRQGGASGAGKGAKTRRSAAISAEHARAEPNSRQARRQRPDRPTGRSMVGRRASRARLRRRSRANRPTRDGFRRARRLPRPRGQRPSLAALGRLRLRHAGVRAGRSRRSRRDATCARRRPRAARSASGR